LQVTTVSPTTTTAFGLQCVSGTVNLFRFIQPPPPGSIIGRVNPVFGASIPLIQTQPTPLGGIPLSSVDGQFATLCGVFVRVGNQTVLDVRVVNPGAPSPTGTPLPFDNRLLLLLLLLLLLSGRIGLPGGTAGLSNLLSSTGLGSLLGKGGLTGTSGLGSILGLPGLQGLLGTGSDGLAALLQSLTGQRQV